MREHMRIELTLAALITAGQRQKPAEGFHSDLGSQDTSAADGKQTIVLKSKFASPPSGPCRATRPLSHSALLNSDELICRICRTVVHSLKSVLYWELETRRLKEPLAERLKCGEHSPVQQRLGRSAITRSGSMAYFWRFLSALPCGC